MFAWLFLDSYAGELGTSEQFPDREAAEAWMGEAWADLRDRGVEQVELVDRSSGLSVYRMSLAEAPTR